MPLLSARATPHDRVKSQLAHHRPFGLLPRLVALAILFTGESLVLSVWLDNVALIARGGIIGFIGQWAAWTVRAIVGFTAIFVTFAHIGKGAALSTISRQAEQAPLRLALLVAHLLAMAVFGALCWTLYGNHFPELSPGVAVSLWLLAGLAGIAFAAFALLPLRLWLQFLRATGSLWALALVLAVAVGVLGSFIRTLWAPVSSLTFFLAETFLKPFVSAVVADPAAKLLGTPNFQVTIAPQCSGLEGIGLILAFSACWLWLFRRECRFPHALILVPAGVATIFLLNAARIATLILIGNAGAPRIAAGGFHSQAGWIAFNAVAFGFCVAATHVPWIRSAEDAKPVAAAQPSENPSLPYLLPFVTILAVGMLTTAASSDFEWLYPIRFLAAAAVLWTLRKRYLTLNWRFSWFGPSIGILVFALWIAFDAFAKTASADPMPAALASSPSSIRAGWIVFRVLAAVVTVPIAEELAFRGFLLRRLATPQFETLPLTAFTWLGLAVSSLAFGLLHGHFWIAGTLAGLLYAWAMLRRGHIGEAVIAHATTNAFLAGYVLLFHKWHLLS